MLLQLLVTMMNKKLIKKDNPFQYQKHVKKYIKKKEKYYLNLKD